MSDPGSIKQMLQTLSLSSQDTTSSMLILYLSVLCLLNVKRLRSWDRSPQQKLSGFRVVTLAKYQSGSWMWVKKSHWFWTILLIPWRAFCNPWCFQMDSASDFRQRLQQAARTAWSPPDNRLALSCLCKLSSIHSLNLSYNALNHCTSINVWAIWVTLRKWLVYQATTSKGEFLESRKRVCNWWLISVIINLRAIT